MLKKFNCSSLLNHLNFQSNLALHRRGPMSYFALFGTPESKAQTMSFDVALILFYSDESTLKLRPRRNETRSITTGLGSQNPLLLAKIYQNYSQSMIQFCWSKCDAIIPWWYQNVMQLLVQITPTKISIALVNKITPPNSLIWGGWMPMSLLCLLKSNQAVHVSGDLIFLLF